jgi:hypothetical protein
MRDKIEIGSRYGMFTVVGESDLQRLPSGQINRIVNCKCDCGTIKNIRWLHLKRLRISSCGCVKNTMKGYSNTEYGILLRSMKTRCKENYKNKNVYFDKKISVCDEWLNDVELFVKFCKDNGYRKGLQIDRIDNSRGYSPDNCRFVDALTNNSNRDVTHKVIYKGELRPFSLVLRDKNLMTHYTTIRRRILRGWTPDRAIDTPIKKGNYKTGKKINSLINNKL